MEIPWWSSGLDSVLPLLGAQVRFLVGELRSREPPGTAKRKKKTDIDRNLYQSWHCRSFWGEMGLFYKWSHENGLSMWKKK